MQSNEAAFIDVFGATEIRLAIKTELLCSPDIEVDHDKRTPEQTILVKEIWDGICRQIR